MSAPAGWYPDPADGARWRWWDGAQWSAPTPPARAATAVQDVPTGTPWIWLVALLPILSLSSLLLIDWRGYVELSLYAASWPTSPDSVPALDALVPYVVQVASTFLWPVGIGWVVFAAEAVSAWLDHRTLRARGVERPFSWPWAFLGGSVYLVGRSVVVKRRTGRGLAPLWAAVAAYAASIVFAMVIPVAIMSYMLEMLPYLTSY